MSSRLELTFRKAGSEIAIIVVDDFGAREVYRQVHAGGTSFDFTAQGRGEQARIQVYIGGRLFIDRDFVE